jgi:hypothetical protein
MNEMFQSLVRGSMVNPDPQELELLEDAFNFDDMVEDVYLDDIEDEDEDGAIFPPIRYVHIRDPFILYPGAAMSFSESPMPVMRLRLTEVDGWLPGRVNVLGQSDEDGFNPPHPSKRFTQ